MLTKPTKTFYITYPGLRYLASGETAQKNKLLKKNNYRQGWLKHNLLNRTWKLN